MRLIEQLDDLYEPIDVGTTGVVGYVDDLGDLCVGWSNGSSLKLILGHDKFEVVSRPLDDVLANAVDALKHGADIDDVRLTVLWIELKRFRRQKQNVEKHDEQNVENNINWLTVSVPIDKVADADFLKQIAIDNGLEIVEEDGKIAFPWFPIVEDSIFTTLASELITVLIKRRYP